MDLYERKYFFQTDGKHFLFPFIHDAHDTLRGKAHKCLITSYLEWLEHQYEKGDVVFGSIEFCKKAFQLNDVEVPKYLGYPKELNHFYGREIFEMDYSRVMFEPLPIFVKPKDDVKRFTGTVFRENKWRTITLNGHEDCMFYVSEVLPIVSEWRVFVHNNKIYGCQCYEGDPLDFPNGNFIQKAKDVYESSDKAPIAYTIDVGVTTYGETFIIELNDMWGTGSYGVSPYDYTMAYIDRWLEIINK